MIRRGSPPNAVAIAPGTVLLSSVYSMPQSQQLKIPCLVFMLLIILYLVSREGRREVRAKRTGNEATVWRKRGKERIKENK